MKQFILLLATLGTLSALSMSCRDKTTEQPEAIVTDTVPPLFMQIQKTSRLYTTEYHIHKIVTHDDVVRLKGNLLKQDFDIPLPLGERKVATVNSPRRTSSETANTSPSYCLIRK